MEDKELQELVAGEPFTSAVTPAVLIDVERVRENIATTLSYLGSARRWRPHVKTARLRWTVDALLDNGITRFKASTLGEVALLLEAGASDVLLAYPAIGPLQWRLAELAAQYPQATVSALVDNAEAVRGWRPGPVSAFLDIDTGGGRTGIAPGDEAGAEVILRELDRAGITFRGLHNFDGHFADLPEGEQADVVAAELSDLVRLAERIEAAGARTVGEIVAGASHTFIPASRVPLPGPWDERVTFGPGTVVYNDLRSLDRFGDKGFRHAAFVLARVISAPEPGRITLDAGLTTIQVDGGRPHAQVVGFAAEVGAPSQEHLMVRVEAEPAPPVGAPVLLVPRHVDTTLAQFDRVYLVGDGSVEESATVIRPF
ncbi:MAG TPA: alanine racemase [Amycolatopsis sp.]|nr:alanine racemase [Amycolatopsis sp.]